MCGRGGRLSVPSQFRSRFSPQRREEGFHVPCSHQSNTLVLIHTHTLHTQSLNAQAENSDTFRVVVTSGSFLCCLGESLRSDAAGPEADRTARPPVTGGLTETNGDTKGHNNNKKNESETFLYLSTNTKRSRPRPPEGQSSVIRTGIFLQIQTSLYVQTRPSSII